MTEGPPEPLGGQDDEPPDLLLAVIVTLRVLRDVVPKLEDAYDSDHPDADAADLLLRITALRSVLGRVRGDLEAATP